MAHEPTLRRCLLAVVALALGAVNGCGDDSAAPGAGARDAGSDHDSGSPPAHAGDDAGDVTTAGAGGSTTAGTGGSTPADAGDDAGSATGAGCEVGQVCDIACEGACKAECLGGTCTSACEQGNCEQDSDFEGRATYSCAGGGCLSDCDNGSTCGLDCSGGGCEVECDNGSVCTLSCGETGDPCVVSCVNGGRGRCDGENCMAVNCEASCEPDASYQPAIDPADFTTTIDNPLLPLPIGAQWVYEGEDEVVTVTVTDEQRTVMGVDVVVVHDSSEALDGEMIEDTYDWFAQDADGNVWYFGEDTTSYEDGVESTEGSWEAGVDGALPGIVMKATPAVGDRYRQEYKVCEAEDWADVVAVDESISVGTDSYTGCVRTRDYTPLESDSNELKIYCPGVGNVQVIRVATGEVSEELTSFELP